jgi:hypothetical protein
MVDYLLQTLVEQGVSLLSRLLLERGVEVSERYWHSSSI